MSVLCQIKRKRKKNPAQNHALKHLGSKTNNNIVPRTEMTLCRTVGNLLCIAHLSCSKFVCAILRRHSRVLLTPLSKIDFLTEMFFFYPNFSCSFLMKWSCMGKSFQETFGILGVTCFGIPSCSRLHGTISWSGVFDGLSTSSWSPLSSIFLMINTCHFFF